MPARSLAASGAGPRARRRRPARRRRRARAGRCRPPRRRSPAPSGRPRASSSPRARNAASAEEWVQPEPCAAPSGYRGPSIAQRPGAVDEDVGAVLGVAAGDDRRRPAPSASSASPSSALEAPSPRARRAPAPRAGSGSRRSRAAAPARSAPPAPLGSSSVAPLSETITGSTTTGAVADQVERLDHGVDRRLVAEHPDLDRVDADVVGDRADLGDDHLRGRPASTSSTPTVFWAVIAVIAVIPCTPQRANAFRSAWMPAPPPESEPAIERQVGIAASALDLRLFEAARSAVGA